MSTQQTQRALVTGATSGIGRATAFRLAEDGFEVVVHGRDAARGKAVVEAITDRGGLARFVGADVGEVGALRALVEEAGDVDVLVNNSGLAVFGATAEMSPERFDVLLATNVRAPYLLVGAIAPRMAERGRGVIVNVSSVVGSVGFAGAAAYSATKGAIDAMTRAWAAEYGPRGVRVNAVAPGPTYTGSSADLARRDRLTSLGEDTILKRAAEDREIADVIAFLASSRASYITGAVVAVDGGRAAI